MDFTEHPDVVAAGKRWAQAMKPALGERITKQIEAAERAVSRWQWFTTDRVDVRPGAARGVRGARGAAPGA